MRPPAPTRFTIRTLAFGIAAITALAALTQALLAPPPAYADAAKIDRAAVFDQAWRFIRDNFYDRTLRRLDWNKVKERHGPAYLSASSDAERSTVINAMLAELNASHMFHFTRDDPAYYELLGIFRHGLRDAIKKHLGGDISYPGIGIFTKKLDGKTFVKGVVAGLSADRAGLRVGDEILSVSGRPFEPVANFRGKVGQKLTMMVRRERDGPERAIVIRPSVINSDNAFEIAITEGARIIDAGGMKIGYVRIWSYADYRYQYALMKLLDTGKLKNVDALIWDLRDGWGGAQPNYLDLFNARGPDLTHTERSGRRLLGDFRWRKPAAILANAGTRSGKEILTYGFKKYGYGEVIGETTAGALLAGRSYMLRDGTLLMVAVNDVAVDGERLEGKGVEPTIHVPFDIRYAAGRDPQLDKAVEVLSSPRG